MKLPRNLSGRDLARSLESLGYVVDRTSGSHLRQATHRHGEHHVTIPDHHALKIGTLHAILAEVGRHADLTRSELVHVLFGQPIG